MEDLISTRLQTFKEQLATRTIQAALLVNPLNVTYFTGFTGNESYLLVTPSDNIFITDSRFTTQAAAQVKDCEIVQVQAGISEILTKFNLNQYITLGLELDFLTAIEYLEIKNSLSSELVNIGNVIDKLRQVKDETEIAKTKKACDIADQAFSLILKEIKIGMTELEVAARLESHFKELGSTGPSFETIVASGSRSALPHGTASTKKIANGDMVTLDFGCYFEGYTSDITRTIVIGTANTKQNQIYDIVLKANQNAIKILKPGVTGLEIHEAAHENIDEAGYKENFGHGTGHGIGLSIHEGPGAWGKYKNEAIVSGNILTVEPGIYLPDEFGVRIEDDVLITVSGHEILTNAIEDKLIIINGE